VAQAIASVVGGAVQHIGTPSCYDPYHVVDAKGRTWKVMADSSLSAPMERQAEIVSPILTYDDISELQQVVRAVRTIGGRCDDTCGLHLHVNGAAFDAKAVRNLVKVVNKQEELIVHALGINEMRLATYCRRIDQSFLRAIETTPTLSLDDLNREWYGYYNPSPIHYDSTRYKGLNLHALWQKGTIEYRFFNATLHAGKVKAYIQFVLALSAFAIGARSASSKRRVFEAGCARYDFRCFLLRLGLLGDEFKTARHHLLANLEGSAAWKNGRPQAAAA
jgi:hypothetical protein